MNESMIEKIIIIPVNKKVYLKLDMYAEILEIVCLNIQFYRGMNHNYNICNRKKYV